MHNILETATLLAIIGTLVSLAGFLIWNTLIRIEKKVDQSLCCSTKMPGRIAGEICEKRGVERTQM